MKAHTYDTYGGDQAGSSFEITYSEEKNDYLLDVLIQSRQHLEGTFSAKFYNVEDSSDMLEITEGRFKVYLETL